MLDKTISCPIMIKIIIGPVITQQILN